MKIRLKGQDRKLLRRLNGSSTGHTNGNASNNSNGNGRPPVAQKKAAATKSSKDTKDAKSKQADEKVVEAPVKVRVFRTVKRREYDERGNLKTTENAAGDQENPDQKPGEPGDDLDFETIEVRRFVTEPARVRFHFDINRNVHFQSASAGCSVEIPCYVEEIEDAFVEAKKIVLDRMRPETKDLDKVVNYLVEQRIKSDLRIPEIEAKVRSDAAKKGSA